MNSILSLLDTIINNPLIEAGTKARAWVLRSKLTGEDLFDRMMGGVFGSNFGHA